MDMLPLLSMRTVDKEAHLRETKKDEPSLVAKVGLASSRSPPRASWKPALLGLTLGVKGSTAQGTALVPLELAT
eukprot:8934666-Alexandrium_andersonii.AAC.1